MRIYNEILDGKVSKQKHLAVLIDPDGLEMSHVSELAAIATESGISMFFVGGSFISDDRMEDCLHILRSETRIPVIIFPGSPAQIYPTADAVLLLSLISGRNPDLLIGRHVEAAPRLRASGLEIISTGYMLIDGGAPTSVSYMSNTVPIPADKHDIAAATALAGEMLGLKMIYLDAGSGAPKAIPEKLIQSVASQIQIPLIVGGGIRTPAAVAKAATAGADIIVIGNALEKDPTLLRAMTEALILPIP